MLKKPIVLQMLPVILIILCTGSLPGRLKSQTDLRAMNLNDSVKSIREITFTTNEETPSLKGEIITSDRFITFNEQGNIIEELIYEKGRLLSTILYEYENGRASGYRELDAKNRLFIEVEYSYDEKGNLTEKVFNRTNQKRFDDKRKEIDVEYHKYYQNLFTRIKYKYNARGLVTTAEYLKPDSTLSYKFEYHYNFRGHLYSLDFINETGKRSWNKKFENDLTGKPVTEKKYEKNRLASSTIIEYKLDAKGNWIKRTEVTEIPESIFGDEAQYTSVTTIREIEYLNSPVK